MAGESAGTGFATGAGLEMIRVSDWDICSSVRLTLVPLVRPALVVRGLRFQAGRNFANYFAFISPYHYEGKGDAWRASFQCAVSAGTMAVPVHDRNNAPIIYHAGRKHKGLNELDMAYPQITPEAVFNRKSRSAWWLWRVWVVWG